MARTGVNWLGGYVKKDMAGAQLWAQEGSLVGRAAQALHGASILQHIRMVYMKGEHGGLTWGIALQPDLSRVSGQGMLGSCRRGCVSSCLALLQLAC